MLIKEDKQWHEASLIEKNDNSIYTVQMYDAAQRNIGERRFEVTESNHIVGSCFHYPKDTRLCIFDPRSDSWVDASVREAVADSNAHRIKMSFSDSNADDYLMLLNPFNHSLLRVATHEYEDALRKYRSFVHTRYGFITDALTGERLSIEDQIIKIEVLDDKAGGTMESGGGQVRVGGAPLDFDGENGGHDRLLSMTQPNVHRNSGTFDVRRVLIEAEAAAGKTVMMRQVIHQCCKWNHRDNNDTVPILVLVIDLQRSMFKFAKEYENTEDLVAVYLRLNNDSTRLNLLMQARFQSRLITTGAFVTFSFVRLVRHMNRVGRCF